MNNLLSFRHQALLAFVLTVGSATSIFADTATTTPPACTAGGWKHHRGAGVLTDAEKAQLMKAHEQALAANATLQAQDNSLKQQFATLKGQGTSVTPDQWKALHQQKEAFRTQLRSAELALDPTLAPIFAKLDAAHPHHHHSA